MEKLTPEKRREIREAVYPFSEAIPVNDIEERVDEVQVKTLEYERNRILEIINDWDRMADPEYEGDGEAEFQAKYGKSTTDLVDVIQEALETK